MKTCKYCGKTSDETKWVTNHGKAQGLVCLKCMPMARLISAFTRETRLQKAELVKAVMDIIKNREAKRLENRMVKLIKRK